MSDSQLPQSLQGRSAINSSFLKGSRLERFLFEGFFVNKLYPSFLAIYLPFNLYYIFCIAPLEKVMGAVQKVFYFHVSFAITSYLFILILFISSILFLVKGKLIFDFIAASAAWVGAFMTIIALVTGMIWGHSAWNTWWRWEPRLVSFLVLVFLLVSYNLFRISKIRSESRAKLSAILGILSFINVPIVIFSVKLLEQTEQLHPQVLGNRGLTDSRFEFGLMLSIVGVATMCLWFFLLYLKYLIVLEEKNRLYDTIR